MPTVQTSPAPAVAPAAPPSAPPARGATAPAVRAQAATAAPQAPAGTGQALVPVPRALHEEDQQLLGVVHLPVELDVVVPITEFRVRNLLALEAGTVIQSQWDCGEDVPLSAGNVQLARSEFEVLGDRLAVRITRLI